MISFSVRIYSKALGLIATLNPRLIFLILIIILNLHDLSLIESAYNTRSKSLGCGSDYKVVS